MLLLACAEQPEEWLFSYVHNPAFAFHSPMVEYCGFEHGKHFEKELQAA